MAFKLSILLIWLSVPLAAYHFATRSYSEYQRIEQDQLRVLDDWESYLRSHTGALTAQSRETTRVLVPGERDEWKQDWRALVAAREAERARLPKLRASHYPLSIQRLQDLDSRLEDLQEDIERAEQYWFDSIRIRGSIEQLVSQIDSARSTADYYERIRAHGIHRMLLDDISLMEDALRQRWNDLRRAEQQASGRLSDAQRDSRGMFDDMDELRELRRRDTEESYQADLQQRLEEFNLAEELRKLAAGDDADAAPGQPGIV
ncbi:hypothetical protein KDL44_02175 [bacterium]|nr:hypothetical protein [bacterium]